MSCKQEFIETECPIKCRTWAVSGGDSKGFHHVGGSGRRRVSAIMDSGSAECLAPENIARNTPLM